MAITANKSMTGFISEGNISFNGGNLSSDTGAMLPLDFIQANDLLKPYLDLPYYDQRSSHQSHNSNDSIFRQQVFKYLMGYNTQADQTVLADDPVLSKYFGNISSQSSVSRFFNRISEDTLNAFWPVFMDQAAQFVNANQDDIILDADSTKTDTYGQQEAAEWIHHYQQTGYHPLVINEYNTKLLMASWLRPGNTHSADEACAAVNEMLSRISDYTPAGIKRLIRFRADAAFYNSALFDMFEERDIPVLYATRAKNTARLFEACLNAYLESDHAEDCTYTSSSPFYGEIVYRMTGSQKDRRVCFKLFFSEDEKADKDGVVQLLLIPHVFAVITNIEDLTCEQVIEFYCQRGNSENFTKELKDDFNANTLSHRSFASNAFEYLMKSLAYNFFHMFQIRILEGNDQVIRAGTFRRKYQKVASRLSTHARAFHLKIARSFRYAREFLVYLGKARTVDWIPKLMC